MFVVLVHYKKPLAEIDRLIPEHRAFLARHYASGHLLLSGRREPRIGGLILAKAASKAEIEEIMRGDPFYREQAADYEFIEFLPTMTSAEFAAFKEA